VKKSFTLIELIVVIAIIAVLAAVVAPNAVRAIEKAKITEAISDFKTYKTAIYTMYADTGMWMDLAHSGPRQSWFPLDEFTELVTDPGPAEMGVAWDGPYVEKIKGKTPWEGTYYIQTSNCVGGGPINQGFDREIWVEFEDECYASGLRNCPIPVKSAETIDRKIDDNNLLTGDFRRRTGNNWCFSTQGDTFWIFVYDAH